ncbi:hypothetical protein BKA58DRAFT_464460 [Alternaria rosae]|uniref:uncharacterized protein n=1 Tax=Alternaria rosae TaxID=1187941 RepID=UPI001E8CB8FE|nr:uncharacterized protein BKA58DRAFT_464460 [Alternaria rosae]KAH6882505.1 hypothetical protein BKA58DRAFT_464460 [Alternaria rosae]
MHLIQSIYRYAWATCYFTGLTAGVPIAPAFRLTTRQPIEPDIQVDFNALLDGSLGNLPAFWITSHSLLAEAAPSSNLTFSSREDRTDKENGLVAAAFISSLLVPAATGIADNGVTGGICNAIISGAGGMAGAVVGQEAGKTLYPPGNGTDGNGTSAPEMEQGIVPGAFIGSVVTNSLGTALAKSICDKFLPDIESVIKEAEAGVAGRVANSLNRGLKEVLVSQLEDMKVETARAVQFASQLEETIRLVDSTGSLATAFEYLNRELATNTAELAEAVGAKLLSKPAISSLVQLSHNTLANLPVASVDGIALLPFDPAADPMGMMAKFANHYRNTMEFAKTLGGQIQEGANRVAPALSTLSQSVESAMQDVDSIVPGTANRLIKDATGAAKSILDHIPNPLHGLPNPFDALFHHGGHGSGHSSGHHAAPGSNNGGGGDSHCAQATVTVTTTLPPAPTQTPNRNLATPTQGSCTSYQVVPTYTTSTQYATAVTTQVQTISSYVQIPQYFATTTTQTVSKPPLKLCKSKLLPQRCLDTIGRTWKGACKVGVLWLPFTVAVGALTITSSVFRSGTCVVVATYGLTSVIMGIV